MLKIQVTYLEKPHTLLKIIKALGTQENTTENFRSLKKIHAHRTQGLLHVKSWMLPVIKM